jgi:single-strand DNA-binding protein
MSKSTMTVEGFVASDPRVNTTKGGKSVVTVTVPHQRSKRQDDGTWQNEGETTWVEATFWEEQADLIAQLVVKGTPVIITGDPELQTYPKRDGSTGAKLVLRFPTLGIIPRAQRSQGGSGGSWGGQAAENPSWAPQGAQQPQGDGWSTDGGTYDDETPF